MRSIISKERVNRFLAMFLALLTVLSTAPLGIFAAPVQPGENNQQQTASVKTTLGITAFTAGTAAEFDVTTSGMPTDKNVRLKFTVKKGNETVTDGISFTGTTYKQQAKAWEMSLDNRKNDTHAIKATFENSGEYLVTVTAQEQKNDKWNDIATVTKTAYVSDACDLKLQLEPNAYFVAGEDATENNEVKNRFGFVYTGDESVFDTGSIPGKIHKIDGKLFYTSLSVDPLDESIATFEEFTFWDDALTSTCSIDATDLCNVAGGDYYFKAVFNNPGEQVIKYTVTDDSYSTDRYTLYLPVMVYARAEVELTKSSESVAFDETLYVSSLINDKDASATSYSYIAENGAPFTVNNNGELTPTGIGTGTVTVKREATDYCAEGKATLNVEVTKGTQTVSFVDGENTVTNYTVTSGTESLTVTAKPSQGGTVTYSVTENDSTAKIVEKIDGNTVYLTGNTGTATIKATVTSDYYDAEPVTCTLVVQASKSDVGFEISGENEIQKLDNGTSKKWYKGEITVIAAEGYQVAPDCKAIENAQWVSSFELTVDDGEYNSESKLYIWLKSNNNGTRASRVQIIPLFKDTTPPTVEITHSSVENFTSKLLSFISLITGDTEAIGAKKNFTINASDATSGIAKVEYFIVSETTDLITKKDAESEKEELDIAKLETHKWFKLDSNDGKYTVTVNAENSTFVLYVRVTDNAGHVTYASTNGVVVDSTESKIDITLPKTELSHEEKPLYTEDVDVTVNVNELNGVNTASGIKSVKYWVVPDGDFTTEEKIAESKKNAKQAGTLYTFADDEEIENRADPAYGDLKHSFNGEIKVSAKDNNSCNVVVYVEVTDMAGNVSTESVTLDIDTVAPTIEVEFDNNEPHQTLDGHGYFDKTRTATVTIVERAAHFNAKAATNGISITAKDFSGKDVNNAYTISSWTTNDDTHTATVTFENDANYTFSVSYTDDAGLCDVDEDGNQKVTYADGTVTPNSFTVDTEKPTGTIKYGDETEWENNVSIYQTPTSASFEIAPIPGVSDVEKVEYFIDYNATSRILKSDEKDNPTLDTEKLKEKGWTEVTANSDGKYIVDVAECQDSKFVLYARITDNSGNVGYISTNVIIFDSTGATIEDLEPTTDVAFTHNGVNGYTGDVTVPVSVSDTASGIKSVTYTVTSDETQTQSGTLYPTENDTVPTDPAYDDLIKELKNLSINVEADKNNSCNVVVYVEVTDMAGNVSTKSVTLDIDTVAPTIEVEFDNNEPHQTLDGHGYFDKTRTATVTIVERAAHFNKDNVNFNITAKDAKENTVTAPAVEWGKSNGDTHTATVEFTADANYTFSVSYTDDAGLCDVDEDGNQKVTYADGTATPNSFTVDSTVPEGELNHNAVENWANKVLTILDAKNSNTFNTTFTVEDVSDVTAGVDKVEYFVDSNATTSIAKEDLVSKAWTNLDLKDDKYTVTVSEADTKFVLYVRITDKSGNTTYLSTNGVVFDKTAPEIGDFKLPEPAFTHNKVNGYTDDVKVSFDVTDGTPDAYSGIAKVEYKVESDGNQTQSGTLYDFAADTTVADVTNPAYGDLKERFESPFEFTVYADKIIDGVAINNNSCNVVVYVEVTDMAGNVSTEYVTLDIDTVAPTVEVKFDNNEPHQMLDGHGYFDKTRTATVTIVERAAHFNATAATNGISITAKDFSEKDVNDAYTISSWTTNDDTHTATVKFTADANYTFSVSYTDDAGLDGSVNYIGETPCSFTVDTTAPTGTVTVVGLNDGEKTWDALVGKLVFKLTGRKILTVSSTHEDVTAGVDFTSYYKTAATEALTATQLDKVEDWTPFNGKFAIDRDDRFTVYVRIVDKCGNKTYISTDGIHLDTTAPTGINTPNITIKPAEVKDIYNGNVDVTIEVEDPKVGENGAFSGLKKVEWWTVVAPEYDENGYLTEASKGKDTSLSDVGYVGEDNPTFEQLRQSFKANITVDATKFNYNNVAVVVRAEDYAGNVSENTLSLNIDITAPAISVRYDNNDADGNFFKADRSAAITVTERNFDAEGVKITVTNTDGTLPTLPIAISDWTRHEGTLANGDDTTYTAVVTFNADGDYTFDIACTDKATNVAGDADYGTSVAPKSFTLDKTEPKFTVSYDNNNAQNGKYFSANRTATVTVTEHNFNADRVVVTLSASLDGAAVEAPVLGAWSSNGDVHTASISFTADADYTFDVDITDAAGNRAADMVPHEFCVDTVAPVLSITNITDKSANNADTVGFVMTAYDVNFENSAFAPVIKLIAMRDGKIETIDLDASEYGEYTEIKNGRIFTVNNLTEDGIYKISCTLTDKAGNEYTEVTLVDKDGKEYAEDRAGDAELLTFSVNREGSTFELDEATAELVKRYYVKNADGDIVITEINVDILTEHTVTLNGKTLVEGEDYTVTKNTEGEWASYTYTVKAALFEAEGEYKLVVSSVDAAENNAFSDMKEAAVEFVVDRTAPVVTVSGLADGARYRTDKQIVTVIPTDDGGALSSIVVNMVDSDGNVIKNVLDLSGDALKAALEANGGALTFELEEGLYQNVQIICKDSAGNDADGNTFEVTYKNVSVSTNAFMIFWANKPLRFGTIGGASALIAALVVLLVLKRRRRNNED